jgi:cell division protein FtsW (lipid II flippase)
MTAAALAARGAPMLAALVLAGIALQFAPPDSVGPVWLLIALAVAALGWVYWQPRSGRRDDSLPALAVVLSAFGLVTIARLSPDLAHRQVVWLAVSLALAIAMGPLFDRFRVLASYTYVWILGSIVLFALLFTIGQEVNGAKLWIRFGGVQFEPVEIIKLFVVLFMASYLAQTGDVIAASKPWSLRANAKYLGPLFVGWFVSMAILVLERDLGMAVLLVGTFAIMLAIATRRNDLIVGSLAIFGLAVWWAITHYHYVQARIAAWSDPQADPLGTGYQAMQGMYALAAGGLFGTGYRFGAPYHIPSAATDYAYAAYSEEFGALGGIALCLVFLALVRRIFGVALRAPDRYAKLLAAGLATTLGMQTVIIVGGILRLFPLTGITLPFFSYGGSSLVTNFALVALAWAISSERPRTA